MRVRSKARLKPWSGSSVSFRKIFEPYAEEIQVSDKTPVWYRALLTGLKSRMGSDKKSLGNRQMEWSPQIPCAEFHLESDWVCHDVPRTGHNQIGHIGANGLHPWSKFANDKMTGKCSLVDTAWLDLAHGVPDDSSKIDLTKVLANLAEEGLILFYSGIQWGEDHPIFHFWVSLDEGNDDESRSVVENTAGKKMDFYPDGEVKIQSLHALWKGASR